jgi:hypothetical protein
MRDGWYEVNKTDFNADANYTADAQVRLQRVYDGERERKNRSRCAVIYGFGL